MRWLSFIIVVAVISFGAWWLRRATPPVSEFINSNPILTMQLNSPDFENNGAIATRFTCDGENISPRLMVSGVPAAAKSLALVVADPDSPSGNFTHWLLWNLSPASTTIDSPTIATMNAVITGTNDFGKLGYGGPCPGGVGLTPAKRPEHRYVFRLFALDTVLALPIGSRQTDLLAALTGHIVAQAEMVGRYRQPSP